MSIRSCALLFTLSYLSSEMMTEHVYKDLLDFNCQAWCTHIFTRKDYKEKKDNALRIKIFTPSCVFYPRTENNSDESNESEYFWAIAHQFLTNEFWLKQISLQIFETSFQKTIKTFWRTTLIASMASKTHKKCDFGWLLQRTNRLCSYTSTNGIKYHTLKRIPRWYREGFRILPFNFGDFYLYALWTTDREGILWSSLI